VRKNTSARENTSVRENTSGRASEGELRPSEGMSDPTGAMQHEAASEYNSPGTYSSDVTLRIKMFPQPHMFHLGWKELSLLASLCPMLPFRTMLLGRDARNR
jgi:hypothetical protein